MIGKDFKQKLKDEMTITSLQKIAEVDEEDSDDAFGPLEIGIVAEAIAIGAGVDISHNIALNRSSYTASPDNHKSPDNLLLTTPDGESYPEKQPDGNSSIAYSRKKKKKGKRTKKRRT